MRIAGFHFVLAIVPILLAGMSFPRETSAESCRPALSKLSWGSFLSSTDRSAFVGGDTDVVFLIHGFRSGLSPVKDEEEAVILIVGQTAFSMQRLPKEERAEKKDYLWEVKVLPLHRLDFDNLTARLRIIPVDRSSRQNLKSFVDQFAAFDRVLAGEDFLSEQQDTNGVLPRMGIHTEWVEEMFNPSIRDGLGESTEFAEVRLYLGAKYLSIVGHHIHYPLYSLMFCSGALVFLGGLLTHSQISLSNYSFFGLALSTTIAGVGGLLLANQGLKWFRVKRAQRLDLNSSPSD
jgi:hypothetical protein